MDFYLFSNGFYDDLFDFFGRNRNYLLQFQDSVFPLYTVFFLLMFSEMKICDQTYILHVQCFELLNFEEEKISKSSDGMEEIKVLVHSFYH